MLPFRSPVISALDSIQLGDRVRLTDSAGLPAQIANWGSGSLDVGVEARTGSILAIGPVSLRDRAGVDGSIQTGANLSRGVGTTVLGGVVERSAPQLPAAPSIASSWPASPKLGFTVDSGSQTTKYAGAYGNVVVRSNALLVLAPGAYFFASLLVEAGGVIRLSGNTSIEIRDALTLRGPFLTSSRAVAPVSIRYRGSSAVVVEQSFRGGLLCPSASLTLGSNGAMSYIGQFLGRQVVVRPDCTASPELPWDGGFFTVPPSRTTTPALVATHGFVLGAGVVFQNPAGGLIGICNTGSEPVLVGNDSQVGPIQSVGPIRLGSRAGADGDLVSSSSIKLDTGAYATGTVVPNGTPVFPVLPLPLADWPVESSGDRIVAPGGQVTLPPGSYGSVDVGPGAKLLLNGTHYWFRGLSLPQDAVIQVGAGTVIETDSKLELRGRIVDSNGNPAAVQILHHGTGSVEVAGPFVGTLQAPLATAMVDGAKGQFLGQILAWSIDILPGSTIGPFLGGVPGLFNQSTTPADPVRRTFSGSQKVVLPADAPAGVRLVVTGSASATPVTILPGQSVWIQPQDGLPWSLQVESQGSDGNWSPVPSSDGVSTTAGRLTVSTVSAALPTGSVHVEIQGQTPSTGPERWTVTGTVTWTDSTPFRGTVTAFDKDLQDSQFLGAAQTDARGAYTIEFLREQFSEFEYGSPDIYIQASTPDVGGRTTMVHGASAPVYNAPAKCTIDLQLGGKELSPLSEFERIDILIRPLLTTGSLDEIRSDEHYEFISRELSEPVEHIRLYVQAQRQSAALAARIANAELPASAAIDPMAFHGLYRQGLPVALELLCRRTAEELETALLASDSQRIIALKRLGAVPASIASSLASLLRSHEKHHLKSLFSRFFGGTQNPVLSDAQMTSIIDLQQTHAGNSRGFWAALRARTKKAPEDPVQDAIFGSVFEFQRWQMRMSALQLSGGNTGLSSQLLGYVSPGATDLSELAGLSLDVFRGIVHSSGATSSFSSSSDIEPLARSLRATVLRAYTREAVAYAANSAETVDIAAIQDVLRLVPGLDPREPAPSHAILAQARVPEEQEATVRSQWESLRRHLALYPVPLAETGTEARRVALVNHIIQYGDPGAFSSSLAPSLAAFLRGSTGFKFGRDKVGQLLQDRKAYLDGLQREVADEIRAWVLAAGRLLALRPDPDVLKQLLFRGYRTATQVARTSRAKFQDAMADSGLSPEVVGEIHRAARRMSRTASHLHGNVQSTNTDLPIYALGRPRAAKSTDPDWSHLFGRPVTNLVPEWRSVLGPAAYFVDVLRYLESLPTPLGRSQPFQALIHRRPDLVHIDLDRAGTFDLISHSQLVLEILQTYVAYSGNWTPSLWNDPEFANIQLQADQALATAHKHPFDLPVDARRHDQEILLGLLDVHLCDLAPTLGNDGSVGALDGVAQDTLELASLQRTIVLSASVDDQELSLLWGTSDLASSTSSVAAFLDRAGISFVELCRYAATRWAGGAIQVPSADGTDLSTLRFPQAPSHDALHRATRFLRLLAALRRLDPALGCHELDAALHALGPNLDATFLRRLAAIVRVRRKFPMGWFEALSLFAAPDLAHGKTIGEDGDLVDTPSWHEQVWRLLDKHPDPDFLASEDTGELLKTGLTLSSKSETVRRIVGLDAFQWTATLKALAVNPDSAGSFSVSNLAAIRRVAVLSRALGTTPEVLAIRCGILGTQFPPAIDSFEAFLVGHAQLAGLQAPAGTLRFLFSDSATGPGAKVPLKQRSEKILQSILDALGSVETGLVGLSGTEVDELRARQRSEAICQILSQETKADAETVLDLLSRRLSIAAGPHGPPPSVLSDLLLLDSAASAGSRARFPDHLVRLQKSVLLLDLLGLSSGELDAIKAQTAAWGGFDLDGLSTSLGGGGDASLSWFLPVFRYANARDRIGSDQDPSAPGSLVRIWNSPLAPDTLSALSGFRAADIGSLATARYGSAATSNSVLGALLPGLELLGRIGTTAAKALAWAAERDGDGATTSEIAATVKSRFEDGAWSAAEAKFLVASRNFRRENLVKYVLEMPDVPAGIDTLDKLYEFFLIDVGMDAAQTTSRIAQAIATVQQFVQRCLMNLEQDLVDRNPSPSGFPGVSPASFDPARWAWLKNYRVWEANRRVFLFPENFLEPELRPDKSEFFVELEKELSESTLSGESIEAAFGHYLAKLESVAHLKVLAHVTDPDNDVLHVVGRTDDLPGVHYHRMRSKDGIWTGWTRMPLDIPSDHLMPVFNNRRLYLYWLEFSEKASDAHDAELGASGSGHQGARPRKHWEICLAWSEYRYGKWSPKISTAMESGTSDQPSQGSTLRVPGLEIEEQAAAGASGGSAATSGAPDPSILLKHPSEFRLIADLAAFEQLGGTLVPRFPLRLLEATHSAYKIAVPRVVTEQVRHAHKFFGHVVSTTYTTFSYMVTDIVDSKNYYSRLTEAGSWWISRPGGRLTPQEARLKDVRTVMRTGVDWVNRFQSWTFEGPLLIPFPQEWSEDGGHDAAGESVARILAGTKTGSLLFDPADQSTRYGAPWRPFFFSDGVRDYYVEARMQESHRRISRMIPAQAGSEAVADPNLIEPSRALMTSAPSTTDSRFLSTTGEYFSDLNNAGIAQTSQSLLLRFGTHYHPHATNLLSSLVSGGIDQVLAPRQQIDAGDGEGGYFESVLKPGSLVSRDYPLENHDFSLDGAYSLYNWELFFHIPMLVATRLTREKRFDEARRWFHYVFDPTTDEGNLDDSALRLWKFAPFALDSESDRVDGTLSLFATSEAALQEKQRMAKRRIEDQIAYSAEHPFEPHGIARIRLGAYKKSVFMKYVDNLVEWADQLFMAYTRESVNEATQLYVLAKDLLGPAPELVPLDTVGKAPDYAALRDGLLQEGDPLAPVEDWLADNPMDTADVDPDSSTESDGHALAGPAASTFFKVPSNERLSSFWGTVDDRLYKIRHGLDIDGVARPLALFAPRLDPSDLVGTSGSGSTPTGPASLTAPVPLYRFSSLLPKALEFCNEVKSFGGALLSALEKNDAEGLSLLRSRQEIALHKLVRTTRQEQVSEAETALETLQRTRATVQARLGYYKGLVRQSDSEKKQIEHLENSSDLQVASQLVNVSAGIWAALPDFTIGVSGFGGSPTIIAKTGGSNLSGAASATATGLGILASIESMRSSRAGLNAGWERRNAEWDHQANQAELELRQIDSQIVGAEARVRIAKGELASLELQLRSSQEVETFMNTKFTNQELFGWMASRLSSLYLKAFQSAFQLAKQVEAAFRHERRTGPSVGITYDAWDGLRKGLLAGETLALDLRRLELEFMNTNVRDPEIVRTVSLVSLDPAALVALRTTGKCTFALPEQLFDLDHPGHFHRRIKHVAVTIPCVTGPYSGVNGKLEYLEGRIRSTDAAPVGGSEAYPRLSSSEAGPKAFGPVVLSMGQNDTGMFEPNLRDERYLPFEGCGLADSKWLLEIPRSSNGFDLETISDVILRIQYTSAISTTQGFAAAALTAASMNAVGFVPTVPAGTLPSGEVPNQTSQVRMFSLRHEFADAWHAWIRDTSSDAKLTIPLDPSRFPFQLRGKTISVTSVGVAARTRDGSDGGLDALDVRTEPGSAAGDTRDFQPENAFGGAPFAAVDLSTAAPVPGSLEVRMTSRNAAATRGALEDLHLMVLWSAS